MPSPIAPEEYYHYTSIENALKILSSGKIRFTCPSEFNDPFEFRFNRTKDTEKAEKARKAIFEITGVFCTSKTFNNILMWSHYASKHKGVVLGFKINEKQYIDNGYSDGIEVNYPEDRKIRELTDKDIGSIFHPSIAAQKHYDKFVYEITSTKSFDWKYEEEVRFFYGKLTNKEKWADVSFKNYGLELSSIYYGLRCDDEFINFINESLIDKYPEAKVFKMQEVLGQFLLEAVKLKLASKQNNYTY